uniref:glycine-rich domain-containing protein n=1 Tax=Haliscomenobacter sp. TaxID=2717303 RepID=UPI003594124E
MKKDYTFPDGRSLSLWTKLPSLLFQSIPLFILACCGLVTSLDAQSLTFNSSGTFIVPTGVTSITVQSWGAGGGGASGSSANRGGGGGGAFATSTFAVVPGASYTVTVGSGGAPGVNGGNSSFGIVVIAAGGSAAPGGLVGGAGGLASASTPTLGAFSGGNGGGSVAAGGDDAGGGGGGAASSTANGGNGAAGTSSTPGAGGQFGGNGNVGAGTGQPGDGGNGADDSFAADAQNGFAPGGGGGGMSESLFSDSGDGADGRVVVSWACGLVVSNFSVAITEPACEDAPATVTLSSNTVPDGTYSVVYSVSGANTASNVNTSVTFAGGTGSFTTAPLNNDGNTTITINLLGCAVPSNNTDSFVVDDGPPQPGAITGGTSVCDNTPGLVYSVAAVAGATSYTWTVPTGWQITTGQGTTSITVTSGALFEGGAVSVVANNTCGSSAPRLLAVLPNANNIGFFVTTLNEVTLCEDEVDNPLVLLTDNLEGGDPSGGQSYAWEVSTTTPAGPFVAGANAGEADDQVYNNVLDDYNTPGVYYFRRIITNNAYCGTADTSMIITLNINSEIDSFSYSPDTIVYCANTAITPLAPTIAGGVGTTFTITPALPAGLSFDAATGTISGTPTAASPATSYRVIGINDCNADTNFINITVAAAPVVTITGPANSCEGDGSTLTVVVTATGGTAPYALAFGYTRVFVGENCEPLANGPTGNAISQTGVFEISFTGSPAGTYNFGGTVIDANGCSGTDDNVEFTIYAKPVGEALAKTIYSCNRVNVDLQNQIDCNLPSTFSWYSVASVGSAVAYNNPNVDGETVAPAGTSSTINDLLTNTTTVNQTIIYRVVPTSVGGGCVGEPFYITITVLAPTEPACIACMNEVNVSLDANCKFSVLPNHVIDFSRCENGEVLREALEVVVSGSNSNIITCAGTYTYVVKLKPEYERCFVFTPCWGKITAEDKTAPILVCAPLDVTLDCYDVNYVLNNRLTIGNVGATSSPRPAATGNQTILNAEGVVGVGPALPVCAANLVPPGLVSDAIKNLGYAYFRDNCRDCGCRVTLKWTDKVVFYNCDQMAA